MTRSWRSWAFIVLFVGSWTLWRETRGWDWEYPGWVRWLGIAVPFVIGCVILIYPETLSNRWPIFARAVGALFVAAAAWGAYSQLAGIRD